MTQEIKRTDEAVEMVDKIVDLGREICERKKKERQKKEHSEMLGTDRGRETGEGRPAEPTNE